EVRSFARVDIGAQGWATPIREAAERLLEPLRTLRQQARRGPERARVEPLDPLLELADGELLADVSTHTEPQVESPKPAITPPRFASPSTPPVRLVAPQSQVIAPS